MADPDFDRLTVTILEDGTIRTVADKISNVNHAAADAFVKGIAALAGGTETIERRGDHHHHHGEHHEHIHRHGGK